MRLYHTFPFLYNVKTLTAGTVITIYYLSSLWARNPGYAHLGNTFSPLMLAQVTGLDSSEVSCTGRKGKCVFLLIVSASSLIIQWPNLDLSIAQSSTPQRIPSVQALACLLFSRYICHNCSLAKGFYRTSLEMTVRSG